MKSVLFYVLMIFSQAIFAQQKSLDYFFQHGVTNSPLLKDYDNQISSNTTDSLLIRAKQSPQISANVNALYQPVAAGFGYDAIITNYGQYSALIGVQKQFPSTKMQFNQYQAISLQNQGLSNQRKMSVQDLKKQIAAQYISAYGDWLQWQFSKSMLNQLTQEDGWLKTLAENSSYTQTDYLAFHLSVKQQEQQQMQLQNQYQLDYNLLNYLCGINDTSAGTLAEPVLQETPPPSFHQSVFFQHYVTDSLKIINSDKQIDLDYLPKIGLAADAGYLTSLEYHAEKNFGFGVGASLSIPIYDGNQKSLEHQKIKFQEITRKNYEQFSISQYNQQQNMLVQQLHAISALMEQNTQQMQLSEALVESDKKLLNTGDIRVSDYILALNSYLTAKNQQLQNTINRMQIINQLNYLSVQ